MKQNQELLELNQSVLQGQIRPERSESFNTLDNIEGLECKICFERNCVKESLPVKYINYLYYRDLPAARCLTKNSLEITYLLIFLQNNEYTINLSAAMFFVLIAVFNMYTRERHVLFAVMTLTALKFDVYTIPNRLPKNLQVQVSAIKNMILLPNM